VSAPATLRSDGRDTALDAVRAAAVVAGIGLHAAAPYMTEPAPGLAWAVQDPARHWAADVVFWWGRCAQPAAFFVLAGVLAVHSRAARSPSEYARRRIERLGSALVAGMLLVLPVVAVVWAWGWNTSGRASWDEIARWRFGDTALQENRLGPAHLWFLVDLLMISAAFALVPARWIDRAQQLTAARTALAAFAGAATVILLADAGALVDLRNSMTPSLSRLLYGATYFAGGVWLAHHRQRAAALLPAPASFAAAAIGAAILAQLAASGGDGGRHVALAIAAACCAWLTILGLVRAADRPMPPLPCAGQHLAAVSLQVYLVHLPIVGLLQVLLFTAPLPALVKLCVAWTGGLVFSWAIAARLAASGHLVDRLTMVPARVWVSAAVTAGIALRIAHYVRTPDVWHDEAAMIVNIVERTYLQLLQPLTYHEAAPPLFMWMQRWMVEHVGDALWSLRLLPFAAAVGALLLFVPGTRLLRDGMAPVALLLMACSPRLLWHAVEAKPYAVDVLIATALIVVVVVTRHWQLAWRIALVAAVSPVVVWLSYPGIFLVAGIAAPMLVSAVRQQQRAAVAASIAIVVVVTVAFLPLAAGPIRAQRDPVIYAAWAAAFPVGLNPVTIGTWLARETIGIADYCFRPLGGWLIVPIGFGIVSLVRRGESLMVASMLVPLALAAIAGVTRQYPFTGARVMIWALPALALLAAEGIGAIVSRLPRRMAPSAVVVIAFTVGPPIAFCLRDVMSAWSRPETFAAAQMAAAARGPHDAIASGAWEYRYYLRDTADFVRLPDRLLPLTGRTWWLVHGATRDVRHAGAAAAERVGFRVASVTDFRGVSVIELTASR
jgi:hypothetical protein